MKNATLQSIIIYFLFCSICLGQEIQTKFEFEKDDNLNVTLKGKVKSVKIKKTDDIKNMSGDSLVYIFNNKGILTKLAYYGLGVDVIERKFRTEEVQYDFKDGKLLSKLNKLAQGLDGDLYTYDKNMNLLLLKNYMNNTLVKETVLTYDEKGRKKDKTEYLYGGFSDYNEETQEGKEGYLYEIEKYEYDASDLLIVKRTYSFRENKTQKKTEYKYDGMGNLIEEGNCISYGTGDCECKPVFGYEYNFQNKLTREFQLAQFSPHNTDTHYIYDNSGNEIEVKGFYIYPGKDPMIGYDYKSAYDKFNNRIKEEELTGNYRMIGFEKYKTQRTKYDNFQNMILDEYLTVNGSAIKVVRKKYSYDKHHNWIRMETEQGKNLGDLKLTEICVREIQYY
ncbi:MAG: hypothetical protein CFE23_14435 [Flavobacterium sp. BFFFF1]|uniref:hypothetical protein n=1 Tax=Flavobacterium sp. BFFFF1 TaxID=2015557 RepID=UPI000BD051AA|nr:hypothetical protein [Flavobacterium sp. BFFFF1]OYU79363.1 MAG: hypothetical protein CFE23_14435 [Flavobacterium sp. BFFFF1]